MASLVWLRYRGVITDMHSIKGLPQMPLNPKGFKREVKNMNPGRSKGIL